MDDSAPIEEQAGAPDIADLKAELQADAEDRGLSQEGTKAEILERIEEFDEKQPNAEAEDLASGVIGSGPPPSEDAGQDMLSEGAPSFDEQEQAPEAQAEFADAEDEFPADLADEESEGETFNPNGPIDEMPADVQADIRARDLAAQAKHDDKVRKAEIKEAKAAKA